MRLNTCEAFGFLIFSTCRFYYIVTRPISMSSTTPHIISRFYFHAAYQYMAIIIKNNLHATCDSARRRRARDISITASPQPTPTREIKQKSRITCAHWVSTHHNDESIGGFREAQCREGVDLIPHPHWRAMMCLWVHLTTPSFIDPPECQYTSIVRVNDDVEEGDPARLEDLLLHVFEQMGVLFEQVVICIKRWFALSWRVFFFWSG